MNVFTALDKEQAAMYRWIRDNCDASTFAAITGQGGWMKMDTMQIDHAFREAYHRYTLIGASDRVIASTKMRLGILPPELGLALAKYTEAVEECATFAEGLGGPTFSDVNRNLENALADLTHEMLKLQS